MALRAPRKRKSKKTTDQYIVAALRKIWFYSELRQNAAKAVKFEGRYKCQSCGLYHLKIQIDHVDPVGSLKDESGFIDWTRYINRMLYCDPSNLSALCEVCHKQKTSLESKIRSINKKAKKSTK